MFRTKSVAILLATFNGEKYIREFLDSLCEQTYKDFCVYVRDDGSSDATCAILQEYTEQLCINIIPASERLGPAKGFLKLMEISNDDHPCYMFADQDDYWYSDKIERVARALLKRSDEVLLYFSRLEYVDENLQHLNYSRTPRVIDIENSVVENIATGCTIGFTRKTKIDIVTGSPYDFIMHDWLLYLYCTAFGSVIYDGKPSIKYRQHANNTIGASIGFLDDFRRRWQRFFRRDSGVYLLSSQLSAFIGCYGNDLSLKNRTLINEITDSKNHIAKRIKMAIRPPAIRQSPTDSLILRVIFLLGRY